MSANTTDRDTKVKDGGTPEYSSHPMIAAEIIYKGTPVFLKAAGDAYSNDGTTNDIAAGDVFAGISVEKVDNSAGAAQAETVRVQINGRHLLTFSDTLTKANEGDAVYVNPTTDDNVVSITSASSTVIQSQIGVIDQFVDATHAYVIIDRYVGLKAAAVP